MDSVHPLPTTVHRWIDSAWERMVYAQAARIVVVTEPMAEMLRSEYPQHASKLAVIHNGYDPEDMELGVPPTDVPDSDRDVLKLGYFGMIYQGRDRYLREYLVGARQWLNGSDGAAMRFFARGASSDLITQLANETGMAAELDNGGLVGHREALGLMAAMDVLLMIGSDQHRHALPGKLFEYIGARKPILAVTPPGVLADFINRHDVGVAVDPASGGSVRDALRLLTARYEHFQSRLNEVAPRYTRRVMTGELVHLLESVLPG
jgi:glycosyltransferase involved in cell wall biosynthesis